MTKIFFLAALLLLLLPTHSEIQRIELPLVSPYTQNSVNFQINYLKLLVPTYNWLFCNKYMLYRVVAKASQVLHQAASEMKNKGNVVQGTNNMVAGFGNVVIGSNNQFVGLRSWCFTSDYSTPLGQYDEGVLAIGNYKIHLSKASLILRDPRLAIRMINPNEFYNLKNRNVAISFFFK